MPEAARSLPAGARVGDYEILGMAGAGGMGMVYKALDLKLERTVALKFLPHDLSVSEKERERFLKEAKTASTLDHTNIGAIHGLEQTADGQFFIVMAYYEGETLAEKIRHGPLPVSQAVDIATQMARGLAEAHSKNIVHRDIKPSNVIITSQNVAKIVDFGIARVVTTPTVTQSAAITGTVTYMSPEQALGKPVDQRSDIWSLGVVLAEMLTGRPPFRGDSLPSVVLAIVNQPPEPMKEATAELQQIVYRSLSKDPAHRYQSCGEMLADLESLRLDAATPTRTIRPAEFRKHVKHASGSVWLPAVARRRSWRGWLAVAAVLLLLAAGIALVPPLRKQIADRLFPHAEEHIAVLPFDNLGNNPASDALVAGLVDSLTNKLSNLDVGQRSLWVVPASEVRRRKISDPTAAFKQLGATLVVTGSVERDQQGVRLTVNLINAGTMRQMGSVALEDRAGDLSAVEDEAVARVARLMHVEVSPEALRNAGGSGTPAAYESYLKALGYMQRYDKPGNLDLAIGALTGAVTTDPRFALGFAGLGEAYRLKFQLDRNPKWLDEASANCQRAAELDDRLPAVYVTLGHIHSGSGKADLALQEFQHALQLNSRDAEALSGLAGAYEKMGRKAEAEATYQRAAAMRPDYWDGYNSLGLLYDRLGRYQDAAAQMRRAADLSPDNAQVYSNLGAIYLDMEDPKVLPDAEKALRKSIELGPGYPAYANLGFLYMQQRRYAECAAMTEKALEFNDKDFRVWANLALADQWLQQNDKAAAATEKELQLLEALVKVQPNEAMVQSALGDVYAAKNLRDKALTRIEAALALAPDDPNVLTDVGEAYEELGDRRQALQFVEKALQKGYSLEALRRDFRLQKLLSDPNFRPTPK